MNYPDIYYLPEWLELYAQKDGEGYRYYKYEHPEGTILYPYVIRKAPYIIDGRQYYDIITPYGFNGPCIVDCTVTGRIKLIHEFGIDFTEHCKENNIIAEYVRFSPWLKNCNDFKELYQLRDNNRTVAIDLTVDDIMVDELRSKRRNIVRTARKSGVEIQFDFSGESIPEFFRLYRKTIEKNSIGQYYNFPIEFLKAHFDKLHEHIFIANAVADNQIVSSCFVLKQGNNLHYHLSANDYELTKFQGNSLLLYELALWGKEHGCRFLHLGGVGAANKSLMDFKYSFTHNDGMPFFVGTRVQNRGVYNALVAAGGKENSGFFPEYRG